MKKSRRPEMDVRMRNHLLLKQIAAAINVSECRAGQAIDPAIDKVSRLYIAYPEPTLRMILDRAEELRQEFTTVAKKPQQHYR